MKERLQKIISACGVASRRTAEEWILAGRVKVNGQPASLGDSADSETDEITVDGKALHRAAAPMYLMLHKPRGYVTTLSDPQGRPTVADLTKAVGTRVYPIGRLDMESEGLLLLTNDGETAHRLAHPSFEIQKTYLVTVSGDGVREAAEKMPCIREVEGQPVSPAQVKLLSEGAGRGLLSVTIREGRKRQVRHLCAYCGLKVQRLVRVAEGALKLGDLKSGTWRYLTEEEIALLKTTQD